MSRFLRPALLTLLLAPGLALAQAASTAPANLPAWEQLTPAQREVLLAPIRDRWDRNPGERARMLERAEHWKTMPPGQRERARHGMHRWEKMSPGQREHARALFHYMRGKPEAERKAFLAQWRQMTPQQRNEWVGAHPAPERGHRGERKD